LIRVGVLHQSPEKGVKQAVVSPAAISITVSQAGCSYQGQIAHRG
jgi:hypothetical protein